MRTLIKNVPFISQLGTWPTGCESVSAVMALNYRKVPVTVDEFIHSYLPLGPAPDGQGGGADPWECFPGDPYTQEGWGCFAPALKKAIDACLADYQGDALRAEILYDEPLPSLADKYLSRGVPVIFWATIGMAPAHESRTWTADTGRVIHWMSPMHCTLLIGFDTDGNGDITHYIFNDPTSGREAVFEADAVRKAYAAQGSQALVIL